MQRDFDDLHNARDAWVDVERSSEAQRHVAPAPAAAQGDAVLPPAVGLAAATARAPHCLVVDDSAICQKVAKRMLESLGCTVEVAGNGLEAVMRIKAAPWSFDLVLMDLRMPVMDGIDAATQIRKELRLLALPIVALSAEVGGDVRELCRESRFDGFVAKPADRAALRAELDRLVVSAAAGQSPAAAAYVAAAAGQPRPTPFGPGEEQQRDFEFLGACGLPDIRAGEADVLTSVSGASAPAASVKPLAGALRVLAVDDNAICLKVVRRMLEKLGCAVRLAANGQEALEAVRAAPGGFDLVLMDLRMPVMDGIEATVRIRTELGLTALPIVAFSAEVRHGHAFL